MKTARIIKKYSLEQLKSHWKKDIIIINQHSIITIIKNQQYYHNTYAMLKRKIINYLPWRTSSKKKNLNKRSELISKCRHLNIYIKIGKTTTKNNFKDWK